MTEVQGVGEIVYPPEASWRVMRAGWGSTPHDMSALTGQVGLLLSKSGVRVQGAPPSLPHWDLGFEPCGCAQLAGTKEDSAVGGPSGLKQSDVFRPH